MTVPTKANDKHSLENAALPIAHATACVETNNLQPVPLSELVSSSKTEHHSLFAPDANGKVVVHTPLPCSAYVFMLPIPFFCIGCFIFQESTLVFDDNTCFVDVKLRKGLGPTKYTSFRYEDIGNVAIVETNMRVNGQQMYDTAILLRDKATRICLGRFEKKEQAFGFTKEMHYFIFGRQNPTAYDPPTMQNLPLSSPAAESYHDKWVRINADCGH